MVWRSRLLIKLDRSLVTQLIQIDADDTQQNGRDIDELSTHFAEVHGGWYEDGLQIQLLKYVEQSQHPDISTAMEAEEKKMKLQFHLFVPNGLNIRNKSKATTGLPVLGEPKNPALSLSPSQGSDKSRWSRLDYFKKEPSRTDNLMNDLTKLLLQQVKKEREAVNEDYD